MDAEAQGGLRADELAAALAELRPLVCGGEVLDAAPLRAMPQGGDDLLLVVRPPGAGEGAPHKRFVHVALGARRARVCTTGRRFDRERQATGPRTDALRAALAGRTLADLAHEPGERRCTFVFAPHGGDEGLRLEVELFSARGLWALCEACGTVRELSRPVATAVRTLRPGDRYAPPPPREPAGGAAPADPPPRFAAPVLPAIDAGFTAADEAAERGDLHASWRRAAERARERLLRRRDGLRQQLARSEAAPALRAEADLMLAYAHTVRAGQASMQVPDLDDPEAPPRTIALEPGTPVPLQARARYERARRLEDGRAVAGQRLAGTERELAGLEAALAALAALAAGPAPDPARQEEIGAALHQLGVLPPAGPAGPAGGTPARSPARRREPRAGRRPPGPDLRRFRSVEDYEILVGRTREDNDRLTLRIARGNDVWLHVGGGRTGSHVVVRLPKGRTASLETLLDAGTLAVHFSKVRGERSVDVVYTLAKNVRKPKGLPPGAVVPAHTKTLVVRLDPERLQRLLASAPQ